MRSSPRPPSAINILSKHSAARLLAPKRPLESQAINRISYYWAFGSAPSSPALLPQAGNGSLAALHQSAAHY